MNNTRIIGLYPVSHADGVEEVFTIDIDLPESTTFHGRDVFARFTAYYVKGGASDYLSPPKTDMSVKLEFYLKGRTGEIVRKDRFGNLITNLASLEKTNYTIVHENITRDIGWFETYSAGPSDDVFLVTSNAKTLEFCVKGGSAVDTLDFKIGERITIE